MEPEPEAKPDDLLPRFRGAVVGAAVADALAFPYQDYSREFLSSIAYPLAAEFVVPRTGFHPMGQYGYATQMLLATIDAIVEARSVSGEAIGDRLVALWRDSLLLRREASTAEAIEAVAKGRWSWTDAGLEAGRAEAAPVARAVAVGLWDHADFEALATDACVTTAVTHRDPRPAACAAAVAAAVAGNVHASELCLGPFLDSVAGAAGRHDAVIREAILDFPRILSQSESRALRLLTSLSPDSRYPQEDDGLSEYCVPAVLVALYYFLRSPYEYSRAVESCLRIGGRFDVAAFATGAMVGALLGETGVPAELASGVLSSAEIHRRATEIHEARMRT